MKKQFKTIPLLLEAVEQPDGKVTFIIRSPQTAQVIALCQSSDEVARFLDELTTKHESENE